LIFLVRGRDLGTPQSNTATLTSAQLGRRLCDIDVPSRTRGSAAAGRDDESRRGSGPDAPPP